MATTRPRQRALVLTALICGCASPAPTVPGEADAPSASRQVGPATTIAATSAPRTPEARAVERLLGEAEIALAANRLTSPGDDNALDRYLHVLVLAADEPRARAGIDEIARRYLRWARRAAGNGDAARAARLLDLAEQVRADHPDLALARTAVRRSLAVPRERHALPRAALAAGEADLAAELARLGTRAKEEAMFVVITAPVDAWSRWIYRQMNDAPPALRLRARSEIGPAASVELRVLDAP